MKVLLASGGSVGDVQPLLALAFELRALGHEPHLCVTPSVKDWVESLGFPCVPLGRDLRQMIAGPELSAQQLPEMAAQNLRAQVRVLHRRNTGTTTPRHCLQAPISSSGRRRSRPGTPAGRARRLALRVADAGGPATGRSARTMAWPQPARGHAIPFR